MNICELNKFLDINNKMDCYNFNPINETATIAKGSASITIDLNASKSVQISEFQNWLNSMGDE